MHVFGSVHKISINGFVELLQSIVPSSWANVLSRRGTGQYLSLMCKRCEGMIGEADLSVVSSVTTLLSGQVGLVTLASSSARKMGEDQ